MSDIFKVSESGYYTIATSKIVDGKEIKTVGCYLVPDKIIKIKRKWWQFWKKRVTIKIEQQWDKAIEVL